MARRDGRTAQERITRLVFLLIAGAALLAAGLVLWFRLYPPGGAREADGTPPIALDPAASAEAGPALAIAGEVAEVEAAVAARLAAGAPATGPLPGPIRLRMTNVQWDDPGGGPFARVPRVVAFLRPVGIAGAGIAISRALVQDPVITLVQRETAGEWNYERALAPFLEPSGSPANGRDGAAAREALRLENVDIRGGLVRLELPAQTLVFRNLAGRLALFTTRGPTGEPEVRIADLTTDLVLPAREEPIPVQAQRGRVLFPDGQFVFDVAAAQVAGTALEEVRGIWEPSAEGLGLEMAARVPDLDFGQARQYFPRLPAEGSARLVVTVERVPGGASRIALRELEVVSAGSAVRGDAVLLWSDGAAAVERVDVTLDPLRVALLEPFTGPLPYGGTIRGTVRGPGEALRWDLVAALTAEPDDTPFRIGLEGEASLTAEGFALRELVANLTEVPLAVLEPHLPGVPLAGTVSGRITAAGSPAEVPMRVVAALDVAGGRVALDGSLDLRASLPAYELQGTLDSVRLAALLEPEVPPVVFVGSFSLTGRGFDPAVAEARVALDGDWSGWQSQPTDTLHLRAEVSAGTMTVRDFQLSLASLEARASGTWRYMEPVSGDIRYTFLVQSLEPFRPFLPALPEEGVAAGRLDATGSASGSLEAPRLSGRIQGSQLRYGGWGATSLAAEYVVALRDTAPALEVTADARGLTTPALGAFEQATLRARVRQPIFEFELEGDRVNGGIVEVSAEGSVDLEGRRVLLLRNARIDIADEAWRLEGPSQLRWGGGSGLEIDNLVLRGTDGGGMIGLDGTYDPDAISDFQVEVVALPLEEAFTLTGRDPLLRGILNASARVEGSRASPRLAATFELDNARAQEVEFQALRGTLAYTAGTLSAALDARLAAGGSLDVEVDLPASLTLGLPPSVVLSEDGPVNAKLEANSLALAAIGEWFPRVRDVEGALSGRVTVSGTRSTPVLQGSLALQEVAVTIPELNQRYDGITGQLRFAGRTAVVADLRVRSGGLAIANGVIRFDDLTDPTASLLVRLEGFRPLGVRDADPAAASGDLTVVGRLRAPVISGNIRLADGAISLPAMGPEFDAPPELVAIGGAPTPGAARQGPGGAPWFQGFILEGLTVQAANLTFIADEMRVQLGGELTLFSRDESLRIFGDLSGQRGTFALRIGPIIRRFDIIDAHVRFFGSPQPDPAIDVTASRVTITPDRGQIEILAQVSGTLSRPTLAISTADGAVIPESELLSFLLFGRPSFELESGALPSQGVLQGVLVGGIADLASLELEQTLTRDLGVDVDYFQIRPGATGLGEVGAYSVLVGKEVTEDVFVLADVELGGVWGLTVQWRIDPEWSLEAGLEPINRGRWSGLGILPASASNDQQATIDIRRRWTY